MKKDWPEHLDKGWRAEQLVRQYYLSCGFSIYGHRRSICGIEVDWIFKRNDELFIVEVKCLSSSEWLQWRVSKKQKQRLIKAAQILSSWMDKGVGLELALVDKEQRVQRYPIL